MDSKSLFGGSSASSEFSFSFHASQSPTSRDYSSQSRQGKPSLFNFENTTFISKPSESPSPAAKKLWSVSRLRQANRDQSTPSLQSRYSGLRINEPVPEYPGFSAPTPPQPAEVYPNKQAIPSQSAASLAPSSSSGFSNKSSVFEFGASSILATPSPITGVDRLAKQMASLNMPVSRSVVPVTKPAARVTMGSEASSSDSSVTDKRSVGDSEGDEQSATPTSCSEEGTSSEDEEPNAATIAARMKESHLRLLDRKPELDELNEIRTTPIFTEAVRELAVKMANNVKDKPFGQYGLLAGDITGQKETSDNRIFWNISAPSSFFICGSQGSGKSHTLSCLLENALAPCPANVLPRPLTGIVFHYDTFISDTGGSPCEAAWLASNSNIKVRVLCPPTNIRTMKKLYSHFPAISVEELRLKESDLDTKRMLELMAVTSGTMPLYLHVVNRILRDLRIIQQQDGGRFNYTAFKRMLANENLTEMQLAPLKQRLDTLESFMVESQAKAFDMFSRQTTNTPNKKKALQAKGTDWTPRNGSLTIVDLSCPCVTAEMACSLFNICLSLFLEQDMASVGRIIALDEAHKYMNDSAECQTLTEALLATIRLQRHLGARVVISTQEPTISPKLLDLCSVTVVHRFTSPDWLNALRKHLAGVSSGAKLLAHAEKMNRNGDEEEELDGVGSLSLGDGDPGMELFSRIVGLKVGEALMFAPSAIVGVQKKAGEKVVKRLAHGVMKVRVRNRTTADGGRSIMS